MQNTPQICHQSYSTPFPSRVWLSAQARGNVTAVHVLAAECGTRAGWRMTGVIGARRKGGACAESLAECCELSRREQRSRWRGIGCGGGGNSRYIQTSKTAGRGSRGSEEGVAPSERHG